MGGGRWRMGRGEVKCERDDSLGSRVVRSGQSLDRLEWEEQGRSCSTPGCPSTVCSFLPSWPRPVPVPVPSTPSPPPLSSGEIWPQLTLACSSAQHAEAGRTRSGLGGNGTA